MTSPGSSEQGGRAGGAYRAQRKSLLLCLTLALNACTMHREAVQSLNDLERECEAKTGWDKAACDMKQLGYGIVAGPVLIATGLPVGIARSYEERHEKAKQRDADEKAAQEEEIAKAERAEQRKTERLARCPANVARVEQALHEQRYRPALDIVDESHECEERKQIYEAFWIGMKDVTPAQIRAYGDDGVAEVYWNPMALIDWFGLASQGKFVSDRGVSIMGMVDQQFGGLVILRPASGQEPRYVLRLDRPRLLRDETFVAAIGRFNRVETFRTVLGAPEDLPVFDLVYGY